MADWPSDDDGRGRRKSSKEKNSVVETMELFSNITTGAEVMMSSALFRATNDWLEDKTGLNLKYVVLAIGMFMATQKYSTKAYHWLQENGSNTLEIDPNETLAEDLELWVAQQPLNQHTLRLLCLVPSFQNMKWKNITGRGAEEEEKRGYDGYEFVASTGKSYFTFKGRLFTLENEGYGNYKLRCFWGNSKPIQALIRHVQSISKNRGSSVKVHNIRGNGRTDTVETRKRTLASIDMDPKEKQDLLTDLQDYFDPDTEAWYNENGTPYRKGLLFHGPPGTGKTSLYQAVAGEFHLPIYYMHLADMSDKSLHDEFQKLPKRCLVVFEEIDTNGIRRSDTMDTRKPEKVEEEVESAHSDSEAEPEADLSETRRDPLREKVKKDEKSKDQGSKITLGALLNILDGPGAKEGRLLVMTTNSPDSLDGALLRPGRVDRMVYLGFSTPLVASITFRRIYGTDPRLIDKLKKRDLDRMAKEFGNKILPETFTPCEIQQYCMARRGKPEKAIRQLSDWIEEQKTGKPKFEYDIKRDQSRRTRGSSDVTENTPDPPDTLEDEPEEERETWEHSVQQSEAPNPSEPSSAYHSAQGSPSGFNKFQYFNDLSHPDFAGLSNKYPHHLPLDEPDKDADDGRTVLLKVVEPETIPDQLVLKHSDSADDLKQKETSSTDDDDEE